MEEWRLEKQKMVQRYHEENLSAVKGGTVLVGSSLMEMFPAEEWIREMPEPRPVVYNRGVGGYTTKDLLPILSICALELEPKKVFINIGTNDLSDAGESVRAIMERYDQILTILEENLPGVKIYLMAYYPVNPDAAVPELKECLKIRSNEKIAAANEEVRKLADKHGQRYIDINDPLKDSRGRLKVEYTIEGMHINHEGYRAIFPDLLRYILE